MAEDRDFQGRIQKIGELVQQLETIADPAARATAKQLVELLMQLHGAGLERMLEVVFKSREQGAEIIDELGQDPLVSSLLVLYGLHPEELETRVSRKLASVRSQLFKMGAEAGVVSVVDGDLRVRVTVEGHVCGSTKRNVQTVVENAIYEAAPDLRSLIVEGFEEPNASGFVAVEQLAGVTASPQIRSAGASSMGGERWSQTGHQPETKW